MTKHLVPYPVARLMCDARYAGVWFRVDGGRLFLIGETSSLVSLPVLKRHKPSIIAALATIPDGCALPTVVLLTGRCRGCASCGATADHRLTVTRARTRGPGQPPASASRLR
jgi:hypothetical protein